MDGKNIRINRLSQNGKFLCIPLDHGITNGATPRLSEFTKIVNSFVENEATAIIVHKGMVRFLPDLKSTGLIIHLSASTEIYNETNKFLVCDVEEAISLGADAVSIHINIGNRFEQDMIKSLAQISRECSKYNMPLLAMMYVKTDDNKVIIDEQRLIHAIRIAVELGADIVKIPYVEDLNTMETIIASTHIPIIVAGGKRTSDDIILEKANKIMDAGAAGISFGRSIFEAPDPSSLLDSLKKIVFNKT